MLPENLTKRAEALAIENPDDIIAVYSMDNTCAWASPSHQTILGYSESEMLDRPWHDFVSEDDHSHATLAGADALLHGRSINFTLNAVTKQRAEVPLRGEAWIAMDAPTKTGYLFFHAKRRT